MTSTTYRLTKSWHLAKKNHDLDASTLLYEGRTYLDWEVVTLFYAALHYVDAYFATQGLYPRKHTSSDRRGRNELVLTQLSHIAREYMQLYELSRAARYGWPKQLIQSADVTDAEDWFETIRDGIDPILPP